MPYFYVTGVESPEYASLYVKACGVLNTIKLKRATDGDSCVES
jgi:hypothetical protein